MTPGDISVGERHDLDSKEYLTGFLPVFHQEGDPGPGIGGFDLQSPADLVFAFDYDHSGKQDHLVNMGRGKARSGF